MYLKTLQDFIMSQCFEGKPTSQLATEMHRAFL